MRMRTIPKAFEEIKQVDPDTDLTLRALRRMVSNGEIPVVRISNKVLINLDFQTSSHVIMMMLLVLDYL